MTFNGNLNIKQRGQSVLHIDEYDETYLIPLVDAKVKGFLAGHLYPELYGKYKIVASSGYVSEMNFQGSGFFTGQTNQFSASVYHIDKGSESSVYTLQGQWCEKYQIHDSIKEVIIEECDINSAKPAALVSSPEEEQDSWETGRAWKKVREALEKGEMHTTVREKTRIENGQRAMRKREASDGVEWKPLFFYKTHDQNPILQALANSASETLVHEKTDGVWTVDKKMASNFRRPFHDSLTPAE
ncbi:MAG: hypothetical protein Q9191_004851 [Dirinaria sp. TL-2023a]